MQHVILWRNTGNGAVGFISEDDAPDQIAVFDDLDDAIDLAASHHVCRAFPHQIVELYDL
jgi:hypothetical protein